MPQPFLQPPIYFGTDIEPQARSHDWLVEPIHVQHAREVRELADEARRQSTIVVTFGATETDSGIVGTTNSRPVL